MFFQWFFMFFQGSEGIVLSVFCKKSVPREVRKRFFIDKYNYIAWKSKHGSQTWLQKGQGGPKGGQECHPRAPATIYTRAMCLFHVLRTDRRTLGTSRNLGTDDEGPAAMRAMSMLDNQAYWSDTPLHRGWCGGISSTSSAGGCLFVWLFVLYAEIGKDIAEKFVQMLMENRDFWSQNVRKKW